MLSDFDSRCGRTFGHEVVDEDVSPCGHQGVRDAETDASPRAGDEGLSAGEVEHRFLLVAVRAGEVSSVHV